MLGRGRALVVATTVLWGRLGNAGAALILGSALLAGIEEHASVKAQERA